MVIVCVDDFYVWCMVQGGEGYLGMNILFVEIGVGDCQIVDFEIVWLGGECQSIDQVVIGWVLCIDQGNGELIVCWDFVVVSQ